MPSALEGPLVIVFGAGSTIAEAVSCGIGVRELPPSDTDFFERARRQGHRKQFALLARYVQEHFGVSLRKRTVPRMEHVFGWVFSHLLLTEKAEQPARALLTMYRDVIARTTDRWEPDPHGALLPLLKLVAESRADATLITFNQDLVIERALESLAQVHRGVWCIRRGYGSIEFDSFTSPRKGTPVFSKSRRKASIPLLKLHGSLNWLIPVRSKTPRLQWDVRKKPMCTPRKSVPELFRVRRGERYRPTWPVIVPPIAGKGLLFEGILRGLWQQAAEALSRARSVVLFGYSFPDTDAQAEVLFRSSCRKDRLRRVIVVNPDPGVGSTSYEITGAKCLLQYRRVPDMLRDWRADPKRG